MKTKIFALLALSVISTMSANAQKVRFGVISDVHQDLQADARERLTTFLTDPKVSKADFAIQLGDLSHSTGADSIVAVWNSPIGPKLKYNVLGNHDSDNAPIALMVEKYRMPNSYYSFDQKGIHFVVLETNTVRDAISPEQFEWFQNDIAATTLPTVIFSHNALDNIGASVSNRMAMREIINQANDGDRKKVIALFCGHHHLDTYSVIDGIPYFHINSASYVWVDGGKYSNGPMAEYKDAVYSVVEIDLKRRTISLDGIQSEYLSPAPQESDFEAQLWSNMNPGQRNRKVNF